MGPSWQTSTQAYREVVRCYVLCSGVKPLVGLGGKGSGVISFSEAKALQRAAGRDVDRPKKAGTYFALPVRVTYTKAEFRVEGGLSWSMTSADAVNPLWRRAYDVGIRLRLSWGTRS